jgi:hypothetical protein
MAGRWTVRQRQSAANPLALRLIIIIWIIEINSIDIPLRKVALSIA